MSDTKKYYYMRLKENFFDSDAIVILESQQDGILYSNILLKMYLKSLKNNGLLMVNELIPYNSQMIASITRQPIGVVEKALVVFKNLGLIDVLEGGAIYMSDIELFVGQSSDEAERKKQRRLEIKASGQIADKCPTNFHHSIEYRDKSIENIEKNNVVSKETMSSILDYLNKATGRNYKATSKATQKHINARFAEGYTEDDFKKVIDNKVAEWLHDPKMQTYLRPDTLFGTKFDSYLNQQVVERKPTIEINPKQREGMVDVVDWNM
jgi:predicted phage replisome organizer/uncharacterized phage protein (TIGR02220 family)